MSRESFSIDDAPWSRPQRSGRGRLPRDSAVGLLDTLLIDRAHIVGISMGGQIAQIIATEYPARVRSLTSMMSWTGARDVGQPAPEVMTLFRRSPALTREQAMDNAVAAFRVIGSPRLPPREGHGR